MKQLRLPIFDSKIKYYNLRIVPPNTIFEEVTALKQLFEFAYGKQPLTRSKPHITLASFKMNSKYQADLMAIFDQLSQNKTFKLQIRGFDTFVSSNTLYLKVLKNKSIEEIHENVGSLHQEKVKSKLRSFHIPLIPHMVISKTDGKRMLKESFKYFQKNSYSTEIEVSHLILTSRPKYKTWDWEHKIKLSPTG